VAASPATGVGRVSHAVSEPLRALPGVVFASLNKESGALEIRTSDGVVRPVARGYRALGRSLFFLSLRGSVPPFRRSFLDTQNLAFLRVPRAGIFVYDLFQLTHPDSIADRILARLLYRGLAGYPFILTCSEHTKETLHARLGIPRERVRVVPLDCDREVFRPRPVDKEAWLARRGIPASRRIVAHVSSGERRKNLDGLLRAFRRVLDRFPDAMLVKAGKVLHGRSQKALLASLRESGLADRVHFLGRASDAELAELYNIADCFAFPSLAEGFGLPVLEAQACGCPVVTSNTTSLREIAGPLCKAVDPLDETALAEAMAELLADPGFRERHAEASAEYLKRFSWEPARRAIREWLE
jgi:glycosyltransferase involved in cell wall biosynthesis